MQRRNVVKAIALGAITPRFIFRESGSQKSTPSHNVKAGASFKSDWQQWPDMLWTGPEYWGNRLQDWMVRDGKAVCAVSEKERSLHALTCQLSSSPSPFNTSVTIDWLNGEKRSADNLAGFLLGAKADFDDYRAAAVFGRGLRAGLAGDGRLFIGGKKSEASLSSLKDVTLSLEATPAEKHYRIRLTARNGSATDTAAEVIAEDVAEDLAGNIALLSHFPGGKEDASPSVAFSDWHIAGEKVRQQVDQTFGPVCFAQYTLHDNVLKLTAQLAPIEAIQGHKILLQVQKDGRWSDVKDSRIDPRGRSAHFRIEGWKEKANIPYRVFVELPLKSGRRAFHYDGVIAREPRDAAKVKMAVFSCNADHGFPDADVVLHVSKHKPDLAVFLGDQFYERTGGYGIQTHPLEKACLDYLRKWYMFGWSYRDIFRNIPSACIPDDHDVYHGNVWGEGGEKASTDEGWGYPAQDQGGYKMPPEWVNMVQRTQTSHLPDPFDPTPVKQGIGVYYTTWNYGGISMAILEDRKFKSAPRQALPAEAQVVNGFIQNRDFDIKAHYDVDAELLGDRQMKFLDHWVHHWPAGVEMKAVLSQTNFCTVATLPEGSIIDSEVPKLPIPEPGEYVQGDAPTTDMDSNGWPQKGRDEAVRTIRKGFALHIAGDQHLASTVQYGVDAFGDAGYAFAGPALNNIWPRRWWPPVADGHKPLPGQPAYTGDFEDGFGNKMTVMAVANPRQTHREPAVVHDRATGYGMVTFNKEDRTMHIECWPRYADPDEGVAGQYTGWPQTVSQEDNYGRRAAAYLPTLKIKGAKDPVVQIVNEETRSIEYTLRIKGDSFRPKVFSRSPHTVTVFHADGERQTSIEGVLPAGDQKEVLVVKV